jgi:ADP-heptose:LPS heptosyltransferase
LVDHPLPHQAQENEYANRQRVADFLNCDVDLALAERIPLNQPRDLRDYVVLCVTTASRWKNWPLANFRSLTERFPQTHFVLVGLRREIAIEELDDFEKLRQQPNVIDRIDQLTVEQLVDVIAHSRAVITNDTSAAHIANFFGIPGAVLFGPVSPQAFAAPNGLRIFHDKTCPFHPCVQWSCANQENWCMRKIDIDSVANHLASVLALTPLVQAANASGVWEIPAVESSSAVH